MTNLAHAEITDERSNVDYWLGRIGEGDKILYEPAQTKNFPETPTVSELKTLIQKLHGKLNATPELLANRNLENLSEVNVRYGVTVQRGNIRLLPQNLSGELFDPLQSSAIDPAEAVLILHESADGKFYFVQSKNHVGWLNKLIVAVTDKETCQKYFAPKNFLVVLDNKKTVADQVFQMGATIPLSENKAAILPTRQGNNLNEILVEVEGAEGFANNFIPCTANNIVRQAFKFLGEGYGYGGLKEGVDSSAMIQSVYRSMDVDISKLPTFSTLKNLSDVEKLEEVRRAPTGAIIFLEGDSALKLGQDAASNPIVIYADYLTRRVVVTEAKDFLDKMTEIVTFKET